MSATRRLNTGLILASVTLLSLALLSPALGDDAHPAHTMSAAHDTAASTPDAVHLNGLSLLNRDARQVDLLTDLIADRVVVVDFIYTQCTTICPVLSGLLQHVQTALSTCLDDTHVALLSISVDPVRDRPAQLEAMARRFSAAPRWYWLTGTPTTVDRVLDRFGLPSGAPQDHPPLVLIGSKDPDRWQRWIGVPSVPTLLSAVRERLPSAARSCIDLE